MESHRWKSLALVASLASFLCIHPLVVVCANETTSSRDESDRGQAARQFDVVVYGGTSGGVVAAIQSARSGKSVVLVAPEKHLGGLSSGGLGWTDTGNKQVIGGISREFYERVYNHYDQPNAWRWQSRSDYGNKGQGTVAIDGDKRTMWIFEPHVAEQVFEEMIREAGVPVHRDSWLDRESGVTRNGNRIVSIRTLDGDVYHGKIFIDATYEGDLMAAAGVEYHVGREANSVYGETWNGVQKDAQHHAHFFKTNIDPYVKQGHPESGLLPRISAADPGENGEGDDRIQAYCFRMCLTDHAENRIPFPEPEGYDPREYQLMVRVLESGWRDMFNKFDPIPNHKTDTNNHGPFSTDNIGMNYDYPEATYERRRAIIEEHTRYQQGLMYFLANDPDVPADVRDKMSQWGLAKDEFVDNGNWPHQLYVREARRLVGIDVMTEQDCLGIEEVDQPIGMGSYAMDSHNVQRYVTPEGFVQNEGDIGVRPLRPYQISYGSIVPKPDDCVNLLVPVCLSSSHIAYGSIRMEPVFMILGQSAAAAAAIAIDGEQTVQEVPYEQLREILLEKKQVLSLDGIPLSDKAIDVKRLKGLVVDDLKAKYTGVWKTSSSVSPFVQFGYRHDGDIAKGDLTARFETSLPTGTYQVRYAYTANSNRATNVPITIHHDSGSTQVRLNQRRKPDAEHGFASLGTFSFREDQAAVVEVSNSDTDGHVIVDAVQFIRVD